MTTGGFENRAVVTSSLIVGATGGEVAAGGQKSLVRGQISPCRGRIRIQRRVGQMPGSALDFLRRAPDPRHI